MKNSIKVRIYGSFLSLGFLFLINAVLTIFILYQSKKMADHLRDVVDPSLKQLDDFHDVLLQSKMYATNWVFLRFNQKDKDALKQIHELRYPHVKENLQRLSSQWKGDENRDSLQSLFKSFERLLAAEKRIMVTLVTFTDYDDPVTKLEGEKMIEDEVIPLAESLDDQLSMISSRERTIRLQEEKKLERSFEIFWAVVVALALSIVAISFILSKYLTAMIVRPIREIRKIVHDLGKGLTNKINQHYKADEIAEMVSAVNQLSDKLRYTADFAQRIGERKFDFPFQPLSDEDTLGKALVTMRDNLKSVDEGLNLAQHTAKLGSWEYKFDTGKTFWSDELYRIFEKDPATVKPDKEAFIESIHPDDRQNIRQLIENSLFGGQPFSLECRINNDRSTIKTAFLQTNVGIDEEGKLNKVYGIVQDITDRRKAERELQIKNLELESKNRELEQFAYVTSHDLQEPLRTISSYVDHFHKLYKDKLDGTGEKFMHYIVLATERMRTLIKDLLDYSRIGRKKEIATIDCNEVIRTVIADLNTIIQESGAQIEVENLPVISGYTTEIKQLFQNLITNAIKFRKKEMCPSVRITCQPIGGGHEFIVEDNGIGIPAEHNERIFVIFQRLHTRTEYEGSGIGLSHCKKIVELHGGKIWVQSTPDKGSQFHFTILENNN